jgi:hypothetical protein
VGPPDVHAATLELIRESGIQQSWAGTDKIV